MQGSSTTDNLSHQIVRVQPSVGWPSAAAALLPVAGTICANAWFVLSTAAFANDTLGDRIPPHAIASVILGGALGHVAMWLVITACLIVSFRVLEDAERVPTFSTMMILTGIAHTPLLLASFSASLLWQVVQDRVSAGATSTELVRHPDLLAASQVIQILRGFGYTASAAWLTIQVSRRWQLSLARSAMLIVTPIVVVLLLLFLALGITTGLARPVQ